MFWLRNQRYNFQLHLSRKIIFSYALLSGGLGRRLPVCRPETSKMVPVVVCCLGSINSFNLYAVTHIQIIKIEERNDSVVECLTRDQGDAGPSLTGGTVIYP